MGWLILVYLVLTVACGFYAANIAKSKGRDHVMWFFGGLLFGIVGLLASGLIERQSVEDEETAKPTKPAKPDIKAQITERARPKTKPLAQVEAEAQEARQRRSGKPSSP